MMIVDLIILPLSYWCAQVKARYWNPADTWIPSCCPSVSQFRFLEPEAMLGIVYDTEEKSQRVQVMTACRSFQGR